MSGRIAEAACSVVSGVNGNGNSPPIEVVAARSREVIKHHAEARRAISRGELDLRAAAAQTLFDSDLGTLRVIRVLSALPKISPAIARRLMADAHIPASRRLGWLANHPASLDRLEQLVQQQTQTAAPRAAPHPRWPWWEEHVDGQVSV